MKRKTKQLLSRIGGFILLVVLSIFVNKYITTPEQQTFSRKETRADVIEVHFIDVGQGDSILIESNNASMLIDAGENNKGSTVVNYLKAHGIEKLDYVIGTHPHSDHIGGLDTVIKAFPVDKVILPSVTHTTNTFEDVLDAITDKNLKLTKAQAGDQYSLGLANFTIISPDSNTYEDLNNYSVVIRLTYGDTSFLLTGDAEKLSEKAMVKSGYNLSADVLKLGHHGSSYSSGADFLDDVNPSYAVISVGKDNQYGHPHVETIQTMMDRNIKLYRTDEQGTIVFTSDGNTISVNTNDYVITDSDLKN
jgi:competence protein ComEC